MSELITVSSETFYGAIYKGKLDVYSTLSHGNTWEWFYRDRTKFGESITDHDAMCTPDGDSPDTYKMTQAAIDAYNKLVKKAVNYDNQPAAGWLA